mmetsp:Transcript_4085/g.6144  ORF Transcript_4085/g.6144 Transcript_4085/m.6144 type:complete len:574 (+) Transcript_4085:120-1841(+)
MDAHIINTGFEAMLIPDNHNDSSVDSNPYAYPYFHSDGTAPVLYQCIQEFFRVSRNPVEDENEREAMFDGLMDEIKKRCEQRPDEATWKDSCGETALHRLCQSVRCCGRHFPSRQSAPGPGNCTHDLGCMALTIARHLLTAFPEANRVSNNWGETPLHHFVGHCGISSMHYHQNFDWLVHNITAPMTESCSRTMRQLVHLLIYGASDSMHIRSRPFEMISCFGHTPLHDSCLLSDLEEWRDADGIHLDLDRLEPRTLREASLEKIRAHHKAIISMLITAHPAALNSDGNDVVMPLHCAIESERCSGTALHAILEGMERLSGYDSDRTKGAKRATPLHDILANARKHSGGSPLDALWIQYTSPRSTTIMRRLCDSSPTTATDMMSSLGQLWIKTVWMLRGHYLSSVDLLRKCKEEFRICHAAVQAEAPLCVIALTAKSVEPEELMVNDSSGRTPLLSCIENACKYQRITHNATEKDDSDVLAFLLRVCPRSIEVVDSSGRLPIHVAAAGGLLWKHGFQTLFQAMPEAVSMPDPVTGLFPFQLAAEKDHRTDRMCNEQTHVIYELLRADPSVLLR